MIAMIFIATLILAVLAIRYAGNNVLFFVAGFFFFFAFGPVLSVLEGKGTYFGTRLNYERQATYGFVLALAGILIADVLYPQRRAFSLRALLVTVQGRGYRRYGAALGVLILVMVGSVLLNLPVLISGNKLEKISAMPAHYDVLLIEACLLSAHFVVHANPGIRRLYYLNAATYVCYCVLTDERDFLLLLFSILLHRFILSGRSISIRAMITGTACVLLGVVLFSIRSHETVDSVALLNQGSLLFVDTYVISLVPVSVPFAHGSTYVSSLHNILPFGLGGDGHRTLSQWLVNSYAPGSSSGYGFSLSAEAFLNFGLLGIPVVFGLIALVQRFLVNRFDRSLWASSMSIFFLFYFMYAIRGESVQLFKAVTYAIMIYGLSLASLRQPLSRRSNEACEGRPTIR